MTTPVELLPNIFAVKVASDVIAAEIYDKESLPLALLVFHKDPNGLFKPGIPEPMWPLPEGSWSLIGVGISEEVAGKIVESVDYDIPPSPSNDFQGDWRSGWRDYESMEETGCSEYPFVTSKTDSLISLLKSKSLNPEDRFVFLLLNK